jgi:teichuronic acid biosynthesis glycosyltransferase TuaC
MRVLVVTNMFPTAERPHHGIFVRDHVDALVAAGAEVDVFAVDTAAGPRAYLTAIPALRRRLQAGGFDVINAHHTYCVLQLALAGVRRITRAPIALTCHEAEVFAPAGYREPEGGLNRRMVYWTAPKRRAFALADEAVCVHQDLAALARPGQPVHVIPPGIDLGRYAPAPQAQARAALDLPADVPIVLFPGDASRPQKGADVFQAALARLSAKPHVVMGGKLSPADMPAYFNAADVVVQTSLYEASPMVVKEAMACGRPIVSTPVGDVAGLFAGLPGHYLCPPEPAAVADAIEQALAFEGPTDGRARIVELGLSLEAIAARYLDVFDAATHDKTPQQPHVAVVRHGPYYADPRVTKQTLALADAGARVTVYCTGGDIGPWCERPEVDVVRLRAEAPSERPPALALQALQFGLKARAGTKNKTAVVVHSIPSWLALLVRRRGVRLVLDHHEPEAEMVAEAGAPQPLVAATKAAERWSLHAADAVVDVSPAMAGRTTRLGGRSALVVDNAPRVWTQAEPTAAPQFDLAVFGSLIARYDLDTLAEALGDTAGPVGVLQVGRGPAALTANPSGGVLVSEGYLPPPELQARLQRCAFGFVGLRPSAFTGFVSPNRLWELVALGLPAVVADTPLLRDLLGPNALYYDGGSSLSLAAALRKAKDMSAEERHALADNARTRLRHRLWDAQAPAFVKLVLEGR